MRISDWSSDGALPISIDVRAHLGEGMDQALGEYGLDQWFFYKSHVFDFPQNWKIMMDGLIDGYHVQFLHGATISPYFYPNMMGKIGRASGRERVCTYV